MSEIVAPGPSSDRVPLWPLVLSITATFGFLLITTGLLFELRDTAGTRAREGAENLARTIERDITRNMEMLDLSLGAVVEGVANPDVMAADPTLRQMILFDRSTTASRLGSLVVFDAAGRLSIDSAGIVPRRIPPVTDREYFQAQREADRGLFVSRPYLSRLIGRTVIGLSRRLGGPGGQFEGVALATIELSYFTDLFASLQLGPGSLVSLARDDGAVLILQRDGKLETLEGDVTGSPVFQRALRERTGWFVGHSALDGKERIFAFQRIPGRPLMVSVAVATETVYAGWRNKAAILLGAASLISVLLVALTAQLTRELGRRRLAETSLARTNAELARLSVTDALTELGNRRAFDAAFAREIRRATRTGTELSLLVIDVDFFKRFNDRYGHLEGDRVLRAVADVIRTVCHHEGDGAFRIGGEEFALLLPGSGVERAAAVAERMRATLRALGRPHADSPHGVVTASIGVTEVGAEEPSVAYARADRLLYQSKATGRDRVTSRDTGEYAEAGMVIVPIGRSRSARRA